MKKVFFTILCVVVVSLFAGVAMAGTIIALRGDGRVVFIDDKKEEIVATVVTDAVGGAMGAISPDGKTLYVGNNYPGNYTVSIIDINKRALIKNLPTGPRPKEARVSFDGKWVGVCHSHMEQGKEIVAIIDTSTNTVKHHVEIDIKNKGYKKGVASHGNWTRDSKYYIAPNYADNALHFIDPVEGKVAATLYFEGTPHYYNVSYDNKELWVFMRGKTEEGKMVGPSKVYVFNIADIISAAPGVAPKATHSIVLEEAGKANHSAFTRDGKFYYAAGFYVPKAERPATHKGINIFVIDTATKKVVAHLTTSPGGKDPHPFMTPDGKHVVNNQFNSNVHALIDAKTHKILKEITVGQGQDTAFLAFTKDGKKAFVGNREDDAVYVVDMDKFEVKKKIVTAEPGREWKTQFMVINGHFTDMFEVTGKYID